jgi:hypothetical protein
MHALASIPITGNQGRIPMLKTAIFAVALVPLASCGGDSSNDDYQQALAQANAAQAQAISLAVPSPCNAAAQCGVLALTTASGHCAVADYHVYSLVSPTADAASAAAANERILAEQAVSLAPPSACTASIRVPPTPACVANACQAAAPAN